LTFKTVAYSRTYLRSPLPIRAHDRVAKLGDECNDANVQNNLRSRFPKQQYESISQSTFILPTPLFSVNLSKVLMLDHGMLCCRQVLGKTRWERVLARESDKADASGEILPLLEGCRASPRSC